VYPDFSGKQDVLHRMLTFSFTDNDGVRVIASLNMDSNGNLFEMDIWKTDFSSLINIPDKIDEV